MRGSEPRQWPGWWRVIAAMCSPICLALVAVIVTGLISPTALAVILVLSGFTPVLVLVIVSLGLPRDAGRVFGVRRSRHHSAPSSRVIVLVGWGINLLLILATLLVLGGGRFWHLF